MWLVMCCACAAAGAIEEYLRAAGKPSGACTGSSNEWIR